MSVRPALEHKAPKPLLVKMQRTRGGHVISIEEVDVLVSIGVAGAFGAKRIHGIHDKHIGMVCFELIQRCVDGCIASVEIPSRDTCFAKIVNIEPLLTTVDAVWKHHHKLRQWGYENDVNSLAACPVCQEADAIAPILKGLGSRDWRSCIIGIAKDRTCKLV